MSRMKITAAVALLVFFFLIFLLLAAKSDGDLLRIIAPLTFAGAILFGFYVFHFVGLSRFASFLVRLFTGKPL